MAATISKQANPKERNIKKNSPKTFKKLDSSFLSINKKFILTNKSGH